VTAGRTRRRPVGRRWRQAPALAAGRRGANPPTATPGTRPPFVRAPCLAARPRRGAPSRRPFLPSVRPAMHDNRVSPNPIHQPTPGTLRTPPAMHKRQKPAICRGNPMAMGFSTECRYLRGFLQNACIWALFRHTGARRGRTYVRPPLPLVAPRTGTGTGTRTRGHAGARGGHLAGRDYGRPGTFPCIWALFRESPAYGALMKTRYMQGKRALPPAAHSPAIHGGTPPSRG